MKVLVVLGAVCLLWGSTDVARAASVQPPATLDPATIIAHSNDKRAAFKRMPLVANDTLMAAAQAKAEAMAKQQEFAHTLSDGTTSWSLIDPTEYQYLAAGENLAIHYGSETDMVDAWYASPTHKRNLLDHRYRDIGIGIAYGEYEGYEGAYVVQLFGQPQAVRSSL